MTCIMLALGYFAFAASLHAVSRRVKPRVNTIQAFLVVGTACGSCLLYNLVMLPNPAALTVTAGLLVFAFASELYIFAFTFVFGSVSASVLLAHLRPGRRPADPPAVGPDIMLRRRLEGMCASGLVRQENGIYEVTQVGRCLASAGRALAGFFRHGSVSAGRELSDNSAPTT